MEIIRETHHLRYEWGTNLEPISTLPADPADAAPYGVYCSGGWLPPGVPRPDNGKATMGRGPVAVAPPCPLAAPAGEVGRGFRPISTAVLNPCRPAAEPMERG